MKKCMLPLLGITMLALSVAAQDKVVITGNMPELKNGDRVVMWNAFTKTSDSSFVENNAFSISANVEDGGTTFILQVGMNPEISGLGMFMLMQPGKMHIKGGNGTGFKGASFSGDPFVADWMEMEKAMKPTNDIIAKVDDLKLDLGEAKKFGDKDAAKLIAGEIDVLNKQVVANGKQFLDSHLGSAASAYVINAILLDLLSAREKVEYLSKFTGRAYNNHVAKSMLSSLTGSEVQWLGKPAPDFSQPDATGKMVSLRDFKGKYLLLDFWASWCNPCRRDAPELKEVHEKMKGKNISFVSISLDKDKAAWAKALAEENMKWSQISDLKGEQNAASQAYKVKGIPAKFLIDPNGIIIGAGFRDSSNGARLSVLENSLKELMK